MQTKVFAENKTRMIDFKESIDFMFIQGKMFIWISILDWISISTRNDIRIKKNEHKLMRIFQKCNVVF